MTTILDRIKELIKRELYLDTEIQNYDRWRDDLCEDDVDVTSIALALEDEFCIRLGDDELEDTDTVEELAGLVERQIGSGSRC